MPANLITPDMFLDQRCIFEGSELKRLMKSSAGVLRGSFWANDGFAGISGGYGCRGSVKVAPPRWTVFGCRRNRVRVKSRIGLCKGNDYGGPVSSSCQNIRDTASPCVDGELWTASRDRMAS